MRRYAIFLVSVPVAIACIRLGFWQLSRLRERQARNEAAREAMAEPPGDLAASDPGAFRAVRATGAFDYSRQVVVEGTTVNGLPAAIVVTPLLLADSTAVLVDRGWVAAPDARLVVLDPFREGDTVSLVGTVMDPGPDMAAAPDSTWPRYVLRPTPASLSASYPYRLRPYLLRRTDPVPSGQKLQRVPLPELTNGPHLGYALQWFFFAMVALVGSVMIYRKDRNAELGAHSKGLRPPNS